MMGRKEECESSQVVGIARKRRDTDYRRGRKEGVNLIYSQVNWEDKRRERESMTGRNA